MQDNELSLSMVREWFAGFKQNNWDVSETRGGDHTRQEISEERIEAVLNTFHQTRAWSIRSLSANIGIPRSSLHDIITKKLKYKKFNAKWDPHQLDSGQKYMLVITSRDNLKDYNQPKSRLEHTLTIYETWISLYRPPEKDQTKEWRMKGERLTQVAVPNRYQPKLMMVMAMDDDGIAGYQLLEEKQTVDGQVYLEFLKKFIETWRGNNKWAVWLLDDNARTHRTRELKQWKDQNNVQEWRQPQYSPELSLSDYGCFHQLKRAIGGVAYPDKKIS